MDDLSDSYWKIESDLSEEQRNFGQLSVSKEKLDIAIVDIDDNPEAEGRKLEMEKGIEELAAVMQATESNIESIES